MAATQTSSKTPAKNSDMGSPRRTPQSLQGAWWKIGAGLLMSYVIYGAFFIAEGAVGFGKGGDVARIVFFHVPVAVWSSVAYMIAAVYACIYLFKGSSQNLEPDAKSAIWMEIGFLCCVLATITGSLFAGLQWGQFWNWDPRETSIIVMLLLYASYLVLRGAYGDQPVRRARSSAAYALVALVPALMLIWVVPRIPMLHSLHPPDTLIKPDNTSPTYKAVLYPSFFAFTMLFIWLYQLRFRLYRLGVKRSSS